MINSIFLFFYISFFHPLHLSVCDIRHNPELNTLEISQRIFTDDLEGVLRQELGGKTDIIKPRDPEQLSKAIGEYVLKNFRLNLNQEQQTPVYLGYELEEDVVWVYMEVPKVHHLNSITIQNTLFFDVFDDQLNLINVKKDGRIQSLKLETHQKEGTLHF